MLKTCQSRYADAEHGDLLWGRVLGMRDELREVAPGVLLGLGSLAATGGAWNCAPFVLVRDSARGGEPREPDADGSSD